MKIRILTLLLLAVATVARAGTELTSQMALEERLEARIARVVHKYDPFANIRVQIKFRKLSAPLPGTAIDLKDFSGSADLSKIQTDDIEGVHVVVSSAKFPLPEWVKTDINSELAIPNLRKSVDYKEMSEEMKKDLVASGMGEKDKAATVADDILAKYSTFMEKLSGSFILKLLGGMVVLVAASMGAAAFIAMKIAKKKSSELVSMLEAKILPAIQSMGNISGKISTSVKLDGSALGGGGMGGGGGGGGGGSGPSSPDVEGLPVIALEALFSDCYWCRRDNYASWLWSVMTPNQRLSLFQSQFVEAEYLKYIQSLRRERSDDHLDPVYLEPMKIHQVSQEDLARWVRANPVSWAFISPMRQLTLPLSLQERLACMAEVPNEKTKIATVPDRKSPKRVLAAVKRIGELSADDENTILHNPGLVPDDMRQELKSLVWLALKPFEVRQKALTEYSAEELAGAWSGTPEVLARLAEALPEKKKQMLDSYLATVQPDRRSDTFKALVAEGLKGGTSTLRMAA